jgi:alpha-galactosidase/6-phospho-beta-glucosidase family protein
MVSGIMPFYRKIDFRLIFHRSLVPGLPSKSVVEVRAKVYQSNLAGIPVQVPQALYPLLLAVDTSENLAVEAVLNLQGEALLGALAVNPLVPSWPAALALREKLLELKGGSNLLWR